MLLVEQTCSRAAATPDTHGGDYSMSKSGKLLRLNRILNPQTQKGVVVAFDHGLMLGPIPGLDPARDRIR